jgi:hypothetical protein
MNTVCGMFFACPSTNATFQFSGMGPPLGPLEVPCHMAKASKIRIRAYVAGKNLDITNTS